ncbi:MAG: hypothetical protein QW456_07120 [Ignisphaera sp.]
MPVRLVSQIVVSIVLLSVAVATAVSSGMMLTRVLSSYRSTGPVLVRIDNPSIDLSAPSRLRVTFKMLNLGDTSVTIVGIVTNILIKGTTGRSMIKVCSSPSGKILAPGAVETVTVVCEISTAELVDLFSSSWTGDMIKANTYYLYTKIYYSYIPLEQAVSVIIH